VARGRALNERVHRRVRLHLAQPAAEPRVLSVPGATLGLFA
jgi:hypothetical protein